MPRRLGRRNDQRDPFSVAEFVLDSKVAQIPMNRCDYHRSLSDARRHSFDRAPPTEMPFEKSEVIPNPRTCSSLASGTRLCMKADFCVSNSTKSFYSQSAAANSVFRERRVSASTWKSLTVRNQPTTSRTLSDALIGSCQGTPITPSAKK